MLLPAKTMRTQVGITSENDRAGSSPDRKAASRSSPTIPGIQLLRAVAATAVVAFHVRYDIVNNVSPPGSLPASFDRGAAGVDLFFVISGFVMVYASESLFARPHASATFLARRIARIVPLYWVMTSAMLAYVAVRGFGPSDASPMQALASYFFIPYWRPSGVIDPLYGIGWTLNYEMFFYVVFAAVLWARREVAVAGIAVAFAAFVLLVANTDYFPRQVVYLADPLILEFVFGMGIAIVYRAGVKLSPAASMVLIAAAIAEVAWPLFDLPRWIGWGVPAAQIVAAVVLSGRSFPLPFAFEALGDVSYALYLIHPALISVARIFSSKGYVTPAAAPWLHLAGYLVICVCASLMVHRLLEKPMTRALRRALSIQAPRLLRPDRPALAGQSPVVSENGAAQPGP
jgi:exopolysaccharide production protein ExoZ